MQSYKKKSELTTPKKQAESNLFELCQAKAIWTKSTKAEGRG